ncbi:MAG: class I SAM-dependent methyltransferase [Ignavibacteriaceae bacterium]
MPEWFEDWFNTDTYLQVYRHRNQADARSLVTLILNRIELQKNAAVLDMACGAGRHSILFALNGFNVTAVDLSQNLLNVAVKMSNRLNLKIDFINADIRHLSLRKKFDLVVNLFTSFGYFKTDAENFKVLSNAFNHLNKNGYFVLDYFNSRFIEKNLIPLSEDYLTSGKITQSRKIEGNRVVKTIKVQTNGSVHNYFESVRLYSKSELEDAVEKSGFKIKYLYGDYKGTDFDLETSPRIIIIAEK